jgi:hypothetical protein
LLLECTLLIAIAQQMRLRRSSSLMVNDPYTLIIALDSNLTATGSLYLDDGKLLLHITQCFSNSSQSIPAVFATLDCYFAAAHSMYSYCDVQFVVRVIAL